MTTPPFRSGFCAILGHPNVGKSTLMNRVIEFKVAITNPKPQTTRDQITGIFNNETCQIAFVDTPGVMDPQDALNECLRDRAIESIEKADVVMHLIDAKSPRPLPDAAEKALVQTRKPLLLVLNKIDTIDGFDPEAPGVVLDRLPFDVRRYRKILYVSALKGNGIDGLVEAIREQLPESPPLYDPEQITDRDLRFLAAEAVREKVLECLRYEVPYAVATRTEEYKEREDGKDFIRVLIFVEHESQKAILIGGAGEMLRRIGSLARPDIEELADKPIYLELWVKVLKNWRKKDFYLREFGYKTASKKRTRRKR
jgi:GTP-binding protein Era